MYAAIARETFWQRNTQYVAISRSATDEVTSLHPSVMECYWNALGMVECQGDCRKAELKVSIKANLQIDSELGPK